MQESHEAFKTTFRAFAVNPDHSTFARLLPSEKWSLLASAVSRFPFPGILVTFVTGPYDRTYATVRLHDHEEFATFLVAFAYDRRASQIVYLENGHYGFKGDEVESQREALADMFDRATR